MSEPLLTSAPESPHLPASGPAEHFAALARRTQLIAVALLSLALLAGLETLIAKDYREAAYLESYGSLVASQLARLGQDAMVREDAIALNVLAEQVVAEPAILQVEIYSMDGATLASYTSSAAGAPHTLSTSATKNSREFTRPIQLVDATAGFVKVIVATDALQPAHDDYHLQDQLRVAAALVLSAVALILLITWLTRLGLQPSANAQPSADTSTSQISGAQTHFYLLLVNLFNGNDMSASRRDALMTQANGNAKAVATLYQGSVQKLSSTATAVLFAEVDAPERSFQAACAALVLAQLGNQPGGARYRYSLQHLQLPLGSESLLHPSVDEQLEDALLHAALAEDNAVALGAEFARQLPRSERLELTSEHSPALAGLHTGKTQDYFLMSGAKPATASMLANQIQALRAPSN